MSAPENPPVFPIPEQRDADGNGLVEGAPGMTLRDWFAGQALIGLMADSPWADPDHKAAYAYNAADAMLAARTQSKETPQ